MNAQDLRNSILQLAVQGKLVEQRPEEETAKELLAQIKSEKEQLIKDKKIKREKPLPEITEGEIPFEIPESWEWVRLNSIVYNSGQCKPVDKFCYIDIGSIDNKNQRLSQEDSVVEAKEAPSRARKIVKYGDIIYSTVRPYLHNMCIVDREFPYMPIASTGFAVLSCLNGIYNRFLFFYLLSPEFDRYANSTENSKGVVYPAINDDRLYRALIPIPPLAEQMRIVAKIEEFLPYIEQYDKAYTKLETFNKKFPEDMKKSILQLAMQGKLVEQRPEEGAADKLYEQIIDEKARLIKEGKIKKEKPLVEISDEEIPYEIPASWKWVRLGSVIKEVIVPQRDKPSFSEEGIPWCRIEDRDGILLNGSKSNQLVSEETIKKMNLKVLPVGSVLSACTGGSIGTIVINTMKCCTNQTFNAIVCSSGLYNWYLFWFLTSKFSELRRIGTGTTMAYISQQKTKEMLIPLPPLEEQYRIIAKLEQTLLYCEQLTK